MDAVTGAGLTPTRRGAIKRRLHARPPVHWGLGAAIAIVASFMLVACGGSDGATGAAGVTGPVGLPGSAGLNAVVRISAELGGNHCLAGGNRIDAGLDANDSGLLDDSEISSTQYVCNGSNGAPGTAGADGHAMLTLIADAGTHCAFGGKAISVGMDADGNGALSNAEISSTNYICAGANGTNGSNGTNGLNSLISTVAEAPGAQCAWGGTKITSGPDANGNSALDASEVSSTTYVCNGQPGADVNWVDVTSTSATAASNTGYLADNASRVTITLPASPVVGDIVKITGAGAGGWQVAQNAGQQVHAGWALASWNGHGPGPRIYALAASADGVRLIAATNTTLYLSSDGGATWSQATAPVQAYYQVTSSADGVHLMAFGNNSQLYVSADSGASWAAAGVSPHNFVAIASSADGSRLAAAEYGGVVYTSSDFGVTWSPQLSQGGTWSGLASSADGLTLVALDANAGGLIRISHDAGGSWALLPAPALSWGGVTVSADGTHITAFVRNGSGGIYTSTDSGMTWRQGTSATGPWSSVAGSADGRVLAATARATGQFQQGPGVVYLSTDAGASWSQQSASSGPSWVAAAMSADGTKLMFGASDGTLAMPLPASTLGTAGFLTGEQFEAVELQYVGNGTFAIIGHEGAPLVH